jgi:hypothetical protein
VCLAILTIAAAGLDKIHEAIITRRIRSDGGRKTAHLISDMFRSTSAGTAAVLLGSCEYILALRITAGRQKVLDDCAILLPNTKIRTRKQAQQALDRYILPSGQQKHAECIENALNRLFGRVG